MYENDGWNIHHCGWNDDEGANGPLAIVGHKNVAAYITTVSGVLRTLRRYIENNKQAVGMRKLRVCIFHSRIGIGYGMHGVQAHWKHAASSDFRAAIRHTALSTSTQIRSEEFTAISLVIPGITKCLNALEQIKTAMTTQRMAVVHGDNRGMSFRFKDGSDILINAYTCKVALESRSALRRIMRRVSRGA